VKPLANSHALLRQSALLAVCRALGAHPGGCACTELLRTSLALAAPVDAFPSSLTTLLLSIAPARWLKTGPGPAHRRPVHTGRSRLEGQGSPGQDRAPLAVTCVVVYLAFPLLSASDGPGDNRAAIRVGAGGREGAKAGFRDLMKAGCCVPKSRLSRMREGRTSPEIEVGCRCTPFDT
jgi:hypothetical protein